MTQKLWLKKPKLNYNKDIFDIVQFGSSVSEDKEPNDLDVAVIFQKIQLKTQLEESQKIKKQIQEITDLPVHITSFDLYSFFDSGNFAKESILFYGKSLITGKYFSEIFGLKPIIHINYSLRNLKKKDKVRFNYLLNGKGGRYGILKEYSGKLLNPGLIEISPEHETIFKKEMEKITKNIEIKKRFDLINL